LRPYTSGEGKICEGASRQQNVSAMAGFGVLIKSRFHYIHLSRGTGRNWSALTFRFAPLLRPPMPATAETQTLGARRFGQPKTIQQMTITTAEFKIIDDGFQDNGAASVKSSEYRLQKILGLLSVGDTLVIEDINVELRTIDELKEFAKGKYYFGLLDFKDLLDKWKNES